MLYGVDVSKWNGNIDFAKLKASGKCGFAVLRVSCGTSVDSKFQSNLAACKANKIPYAVYAYAEANTISGAQAEAKFALSQIAGSSPLFVAYDAECAALAAQSKSQTTDIACAFLSLIKAAGYLPYLYCNRNWQINEIDVAFCRNKGFGFWLAMYSGESPEHVNYSGACDIWQYSSTGVLAGNGSQYIDLDVCYNPALVARIGAGSVNPNFCDTASLTVCPGMEYQFKSGSQLSCANSSFAQVSHVVGADGYHYTKFKAQALTTGVGFYENGKRVCVAVVRKPFSDTTALSKKVGEIYQFKTDFPVVCGTTSVFQQVGQPLKSGVYWLTKFKAVGRGEAGFYCGSTRICVGTVV
jgi:GH25 family lysozyme M1 (1,4-beta-N-acetylmuramidase)